MVGRRPFGSFWVVRQSGNAKRDSRVRRETKRSGNAITNTTTHPAPLLIFASPARALPRSPEKDWSYPLGVRIHRLWLYPRLDVRGPRTGAPAPGDQPARATKAPQPRKLGLHRARHVLLLLTTRRRPLPNPGHPFRRQLPRRGIRMEPMGRTIRSPAQTPVLGQRRGASGNRTERHPHLPLGVRTGLPQPAGHWRTAGPLRLGARRRPARLSRGRHAQLPVVLPRRRIRNRRLLCVLAVATRR